MNAEKRKEKAIELMHTFDIYKPYIKGFQDNDMVCFFEQFGGFWVYQEPEIEKKMKEIEKRYNCTVYAITHEFTEVGEIYNFLMVTPYKEEWDDLVINYQGDYVAVAYVWNKTDDDFSELGSIYLRSFGGGIKRVG